MILSVHSEMVDFGSGLGPSDFEAQGIAALPFVFQNRGNIGLDEKKLFLNKHYLRFIFFSMISMILYISPFNFNSFSTELIE
jgi:hypothetical protein